ncbi:hypothetical protein MSSAC_3770 [Methanosarcina siciliae C2J]|uniref:Uncharacterized protein n=2 Tax=Methanosarcina siciliae TaxID=38027 RepID=A0A0E3PSW2_9EURY|nr:hypothetical protein MSSAC_3770 [Methanosarcina siciliae C2J]
MYFQNNSDIGTLLLAMLLVYTVLMPAVSAEENLKTGDKPSEWEQGLIDALNSNTENLSTDDVIADYCKANRHKISMPKLDTASDENNSRTYQLKDGSNITFTNQGYFVIDNLIVEETKNNTFQLNNQKNTIQPSSQKSEMDSQSLVNPDYTSTLTHSVSEYNFFGWKLFTVTTEGYFGYDHKSVQPYHLDSWYVHNMPLNLWQISNWEDGENLTSNNTAEVYGQGNFHYGFEYRGNSITVQNYYIKVYLSCDQNGNYGTHYSITDLNQKLKISPLNLEF